MESSTATIELVTVRTHSSRHDIAELKRRIVIKFVDVSAPVGEGKEIIWTLPAIQ